LLPFAFATQIPPCQNEGRGRPIKGLLREGQLRAGRGPHRGL